MADDSHLEYDETVADDETQSEPAGDDTELPVKEGAIVGVSTFLLSYVSTFALVQGALAMAGFDGEDVAASWEIAAWTMLSGFGAAVEADGEVVSLMEAVPTEFLFVFSPVAVAVSLLVLVAAGYSMAKYTGASDAGEAAKAGALIVPGWLLLTVGFAVLASWESEAEVTYTVATSDAILYAGLLIPALFAIAGGLLYSWPDPVEKAMAKLDG